MKKPNEQASNWVRSGYSKVVAAKRRGLLIPQPCERCGNPKVAAHHDDYSRPLDVMWLCHKHHMMRHKEIVGWRLPRPTVQRTNPREARIAISFRVTSKMCSQMESLSDQRGKTVSFFVREAIDEYLKKKPK